MGSRSLVTKPKLTPTTRELPANPPAHMLAAGTTTSPAPALSLDPSALTERLWPDTGAGRLDLVSPHHALDMGMMQSSLCMFPSPKPTVYGPGHTPHFW